MDFFHRQALIMRILLKNQGPVNGNVLAEFADSSLKTIKKEIDDLNYTCRENGCEIVSKVGTGYEIEVFDNDKYEYFRNEIERKSRYHYFFYDAQGERIHYIVRRFLTGKSIYINDLVYELNSSESTIRRDLPEVKNRLARYSLNIVNRTNKGMALEGNEWDIRLCFLYEDFLYHFMQKVYCKEPEPDHERSVSISQEYDNYINDRICRVLRRHQFRISHSSLMRFKRLFILFINRHKLRESMTVNDRVKDLDISYELPIVKEMIEELNNPVRSDFNETELRYLSGYLRGCRLLLYPEFLQIKEADYVLKIVEGFEKIMNQTFDLSQIDTSVLHKDLCVELTKIFVRSILGVHVFKAFVQQYTNDGLLSLDQCALLADYLRKNTDIPFENLDIAAMYHAFIKLSHKREDCLKKKVYVISDLGFFASRTYADRFNRYTQHNDIEFVPYEFLWLNDKSVEECVGIITDIDEITKLFPQVRTRHLSLLRSGNDFENTYEYFSQSEADFKKMFTVDNIYVTNSISSKTDVYEYVKTVLDGSVEQKKQFIAEAKELSRPFGSNRMNNFFVVNALNDYFGESFIKIIYLTTSVHTGRNAVNKIIVYNGKGNDMREKALLTRRVSSLLHSYETFLIDDKEKLYEKLCSIMYTG